MRHKLINILIWAALAAALIFTLETVIGCQYELRVHGINRSSQHRLGMIEKTMQSIVKIVATGHEDRPATGFYIGNGVIVTAGYILEYPQLDRVIFENGDECPVLDRYEHQDYDCGFYFIEEPNCHALKLDTSELQRGETVYIFGHPTKAVFTVTKGIISGRTDMEEYFGEVLLGITDAIAHHGNSGSPLVNEKGNVRGMYVGSYRVRMIDGSFPAGCAIFIPAFDIMKSLNEAIVKEKSNG